MNLSKIPEIGEAKSRKLYEEYGVVTVAELRKLYETDKSVLTQKQATGLKYLEDLSTRIPRDEMTDWNMLLYQVYLEVVNEVEPENPDFIMVGSYRRKAVSSGDIDILITSDNKGVDMMKLFKEKLLEKGIIESSANIFAAGDTKIMAVVKLKDTYRHLDIFYHPRDIYPFAILHSTGSADFNAELRSFFISKGYSLSEKGIKRGSPKGPSVVSSDIQPKLQKPRIEEEKDIFKFVGIPFIEPEKRTGGINFEKISTQ
jgi:DNA polymerase/3'-5' exonuclease PolX